MTATVEAASASARAAEELRSRRSGADRLGSALRRLGEDLALERRRNAALRAEVSRLRRQLASARQQEYREPSSSGG